MNEGVLDHESTANASRVPEDWRPGSLKLSETRLLLTIPEEKFQLYAVPTERGSVCTIAIGIGSEIVSSLREGFTMSISKPTPGGPLYIYGLLEDNVEAAHVRVSGTLVPAVVGKNGYFAKIEDPTTTVSNVAGFELMYRDGTSRRVALDLS
jgi:hypothetical protein